MHQVDACMFLSSNPKKEQSVSTSSQSIVNRIFFVSFHVHDHLAMKALLFYFEKSNIVIILMVEASLVTFWQFSIFKAETQLFEKIN